LGEMAELAERIEEELTQAFEVKDRNALRRYARLIEDHTVDRPTFAVTNGEVQRAITVLQGDVRVVAETIKQGLAFAEKRFEQVYKRFEQVDKRFEQVDKRFEQVDKRFEQVDKRFEQVDKRFEQVDKRFEEFDQRFARLQWGLTLGFTVLAVLIAAFGLFA
jgi:septal ring factor EnvC (AmiA/AmiB activator)